MNKLCNRSALWLFSCSVIALLLGGCAKPESDAAGQGDPIQPPSIQLAAGSSSVTSGATTTLTWSVNGATSCVSSGAWSGNSPLSGSTNVGPLTSDSTFTLTCNGAGGQSVTSVTVLVDGVSPPTPMPAPAPTVSLGASPAAITSGASSTLTWSSTNADSCMASGSSAFTGTKYISGTQSVSPTSTTTYTLSCTGAGGSDSASYTVTVTAPPLAPTVSLNANPTSIASGDSVTLSWSSQNATGCTASSGWSGSKAASGSQVVGPLTQSTTYLLTCSGDGGSANASVTVSVMPVVPAPVLTFTATPATVASNGSTVLQWDATYASSCTASGAWSGVRELVGAETISAITSQKTFQLDCIGSGGSASKSVTVTVSGGASAVRLTGEVDSSLVDREGVNKVYVFAAGVTPDDIDSDTIDPIVTGAVSQDDDGCGWHYEISSLAAGTYTVAFTKQAALDNPATNDVLTFVGTAQVTVGASDTTKDFAAARVLRVGPTRTYQKPSDILGVLQNGDVVEIDAGEYPDDIVVWRNSNITLRGVGGRAHMKATTLIPYTGGSDRENGMGIWVMKANNVTVENVEFSGATVPDENGAGIRADASNITVCGSYFHDNENGILGGLGTVWIEHSEFNHNGLGDRGYTHNLYIGYADRLVFKYNYSHHAHIGHNLKSRAAENYILYNRLMDESDGDSSYIVDTPNGGLTYLIGNLIQQGPSADNSSMVAYGAEGLSAGRTHKLFVVNNTLVNDRGAGTFISINSGTTEAKVINNLFVDNGTLVSGPAVLSSNLRSDGSDLEDRTGYDYRLLGTSSARNAGTDPGTGEGRSLVPEFQYVHSTQRELRPRDAALDVGALEVAP